MLSSTAIFIDKMHHLQRVMMRYSIYSNVLFRTIIVKNLQFESVRTFKYFGVEDL